MIEKKEDARFDKSRKAFRRPDFELAGKEMKRLTVLERVMHISPAGPRTRRSQAGNHGASGVEKPQETRSREVAPRRKVGSLDRQVPGGHTSKVRCRSRCTTSWFLLSLKQRTLGSSGPQYQTGLWPLSLALLSLFPVPPSAHKRL